MLIKTSRLYVVEIIKVYNSRYGWLAYPIYGYRVTAIHPQKIPGGRGEGARRIARSWKYWTFGFV